ncbi:MAG: hypothetical protein MUF18_03735 [Fimbriiglobus sp.]|nr:hypothetical protein [Fimbriiglobus sp.]
MKLKKVLLVGGIAALGLALVGGFGAVKKQIAYARQTVQSWTDEHMDPEQEIKRLRSEAAKLENEENAIKNDLAKEIAAAEKLDKQLKSLRGAVEGERQALLAFGESIKDAEANSKKVSVGKVALDVAEAKKKLVSDKNTVVKRERMLADLETSLKVREEAKATLYGQLNQVQDIRRTTAAELDALDAECKSLKLQAMKNKYHRDDSAVGSLRDGMDKVREKLTEKRIRVGLDDGKGSPDAPVTESVDEILAPINGGK